MIVMCNNQSVLFWLLHSYQDKLEVPLGKLGVTFYAVAVLIGWDIFMKKIKRRRIRSVVRALYCDGKCLGFVSWGRTKITEKQRCSTAFALRKARPSRGSDDHVKWRTRLQ